MVVDCSDESCILRQSVTILFMLVYTGSAMVLDAGFLANLADDNIANNRMRIRVNNRRARKLLMRRRKTGVTQPPIETMIHRHETYGIT